MFIGDNGIIVIEHTKSNGITERYFSYEVPYEKWNDFVEDAIIKNHLLIWSQEKFESFDENDYISDDITYTVEFVLDDKTIEYNGGTSSKGVMMFRYLFDKFFSVPDGIDYTWEEVVPDID